MFCVEISSRKKKKIEIEIEIERRFLALKSVYSLIDTVYNLILWLAYLFCHVAPESLFSIFPCSIDNIESNLTMDGISIV